MGGVLEDGVPADVVAPDVLPRLRADVLGATLEEVPPAVDPPDPVGTPDGELHAATRLTSNAPPTRARR